MEGSSPARSPSHSITMRLAGVIREGVGVHNVTSDRREHATEGDRDR